MKIATFCTNQYETPPDPKTKVIYMPLHIVQQLAKGLTDMGHSVTVFGAEGSRVDSKLETLGMEPLYKNKELKKTYSLNAAKTVENYETIMISEMFVKASKGEYDLIHIHPIKRSIPFVPLVDVPVVFTMHNPIGEMGAYVFNWFNKYKNVNFVSISDAQRAPAPDLRYIGTVYNGVDLSQFEYNQDPDDYFVTAGRLVPEKGIDTAIRVAKETGNKLKFAGTISDKYRDYYEQKIKPHVDGEQIEYLGMLDRSGIAKLMSKAKAFLFPIEWEEPFGLVMIESLASGTPVIAYNRGSVPEVLDDGKTGYIVEDEEGMKNGIKKIDKISRNYCREYVEKKFGVDQMVKDYERIFEKAIKQK